MDFLELQYADNLKISARKLFTKFSACVTVSRQRVNHGRR